MTDPASRTDTTDVHLVSGDTLTLPSDCPDISTGREPLLITRRWRIYAHGAAWVMTDEKHHRDLLDAERFRSMVGRMPGWRRHLVRLLVGEQA